MSNHVDFAAGVRAVARIHAAWATQAESCRETRPCYGCRLKAHRAIEAALGLPASSAQDHHKASLGPGRTVVDEEHEHENWCRLHNRRMVGVRATGNWACKAYYEQHEIRDGDCILELRQRGDQRPYWADAYERMTGNAWEPGTKWPMDLGPPPDPRRPERRDGSSSPLCEAIVGVGCRCRRDLGHQGGHACSHLTPDPRNTNYAEGSEQEKR